MMDHWISDDSRLLLALSFHFPDLISGVRTDFEKRRTLIERTSIEFAGGFLISIVNRDCFDEFAKYSCVSMVAEPIEIGGHGVLRPIVVDKIMFTCDIGGQTHSHEENRTHVVSRTWREAELGCKRICNTAAAWNAGSSAETPPACIE